MKQIAPGCKHTHPEEQPCDIACNGCGRFVCEACSNFLVIPYLSQTCTTCHDCEVSMRAYIRRQEANAEAIEETYKSLRDWR